jgi:hypothetical protein
MDANYIDAILFYPRAWRANGESHNLAEMRDAIFPLPSEGRGIEGEG